MTKLLLPELGTPIDAKASKGEVSLARELLKQDLKLARKAMKVAAKQQLLRNIHEAPPRLPDGKFQVISMDPPWSYDTSQESGSGHRGLTDYPTMSLLEIAELPVAALADTDCVLWLWATNSFVIDAGVIARGWGFDVKTVLTWDKIHHGVGHYLQNVTEQCLCCTRGKPVIDLQGVWRAHDEGTAPAPTTSLRCPREEGHSRKPRMFYRLVELLCPCVAGGRLEMFAREQRPGWIAWGAETDKYRAGA